MYTLVPFGGAGAFFAVECARTMGLKNVLHPRAAGVFSALGLLQAPVAIEKERTIFSPIQHGANPILAARDELIDEIRKSLDEWREGSEIFFITSLECRYKGQTHTLEIIPGDVISTDSISNLFESAYQARYTYLHSGMEIEVVNVRVRGEIPCPAIEFDDVQTTNRDLGLSRIGSTRLRLEKRWINAPVYSRDMIPIDTLLNGPALVVEDFATLYLPPESSIHLDRKGNANVELK
jgi:N-methylhydantoinase A/oxoprolinase/acetone carboxylase beta subunit